MSALPLIEAVQRAGGAITIQGDRLRLSAPEPLPENLLQELRTHKAEVIDHLQHTRQSALGEHAAEPIRKGAAPPVATVAAWADGVARLRAMPPPRRHPVPREGGFQ
jgi:TubC N-terminal docking domain